MADKNGMEMLLGGQETVQMLQRMERLKRLMGTGIAKQVEERAEVRQEGPFLRSRREDAVTKAMPSFSSPPAALAAGAERAVCWEMMPISVWRRFRTLQE